MTTGAKYSKDNLYRAETSRLMSLQGRDIGEIPPVHDPKRRSLCRRDFQKFCEQYHADLFSRAWSPDHKTAIGKIESAVLHGAQFAFAMPRGSGKTTLCYIACEWALLYAHRSFVVLIGSEATAAEELLDALRTDMENNDLLLEDFPEVVYPIRRLEGIAHRCNGQLCCGERTQMTWTGHDVVLPTVAGSAASGAAIRISGLTGRLRGMQSKTPDGHSIRPDLVIVDDPQTDDSARSVSQNDYRERLLSGAVLGLAGPGRQISACMPCTIIRHGDMAQRILDRKRHPEWRGEITKLVYKWPENTKLWEQYEDIWRTELQNDGDGSIATQFYVDNQAEMDEGSEVAWPERYLETEQSALQHAYNLKLRIGAEAFDAEYQNDPHEDLEDSRPITVTADDVCQKILQVKRRRVPDECGHVVAFIDLSHKCLWWMVAGMSDAFTGHVMDYGIWPQQRARYTTLDRITNTLQRKYPGHGLEAAILKGLEDLTEKLICEWTRETEGALPTERILIDEGDGEHMTIVRNFCRRSKYASILLPSKGRGIRAANKPLCDGKPKSGEKFGDHWKIIRNRSAGRTVHMDVNYWKTFVMRRLETPVGDSGAYTLFKSTPREHQMVADQICAEVPTEVEDVTSGSRVIEWTCAPHKDNHFMDCLVGCSVAASIGGSRLAASKPSELTPRKRKKRVTYL